MIKVVFIILFSSCINHILLAQNNAKLESLKYGIFHKPNYNLVKKTKVAEYRILEIEEYYISSPSMATHTGVIDESNKDTFYSCTYVFDKKTHNLTKIKTTSDSTLYFYNGDRRDSTVVYHEKNSYFYKVNGASKTYRNIDSFPIIISFSGDSSYSKYIFNSDSLLIREERYDTSRILDIYIEYKYHNNFIESELWDTSSEIELPEIKTYYYFTPDGGILTTSIINYLGKRLMSNVSLETFNEDGLLIEKVAYGEFSQFRTTYHYDEKNLLILKKHYINDSLKSERLYKYIIH